MSEGHSFKPTCQTTYPTSHFFYQSQFLSLGSGLLHHLFIFNFPPVFYVSLLFTCFFYYNNLLYSVFIQNLFLSLTLRIPLLLLQTSFQFFIVITFISVIVFTHQCYNFFYPEIRLITFLKKFFRFCLLSSFPCWFLMPACMNLPFEYPDTAM